MADKISRGDHVDVRQAQWAREVPDIDTEPMAIIGRAHRVVALVRSGIEQTFAKFGLDRGEFDVISTLRRSGPPYRLTPTDLYRSLMMSSGGMTHRLARLERAGLIVRQKSDSDGRSMLVALTDDGRQLAERAFRVDMASEAACLQALDPAEREQLASLLRKLVLSLEETAGGQGDTAADPHS